MATKKDLMTCEVEDFIAAMNPKKECKRKTTTTPRTTKDRQHKTKA